MISEQYAQSSVSVAPAASGTTGVDTTDRQAIISQLQQLEASLAPLPDTPEMHEVRAPLLARHAALKSKLSSTKGLGVRLDGCHSALERARARLQTAISTVEAVLQAKTEAEQQVANFESELRELEAAIQTQQHQQQQDATANSVEKLQSGLEQVMSEMASSPHTSQEEVRAVMDGMTALFRQVSEISSRCLRQSAAAQLPSPAHAACLQGGDAIMTAGNQSDRSEEQRFQALLLANAVSAQAGAGGA